VGDEPPAQLLEAPAAAVPNVAPTQEALAVVVKRSQPLTGAGVVTPSLSASLASISSERLVLV
jgi:hypothetical protein